MNQVIAWICLVLGILLNDNGFYLTSFVLFVTGFLLFVNVIFKQLVRRK